MNIKRRESETGMFLMGNLPGTVRCDKMETDEKNSGAKRGTLTGVQVEEGLYATVDLMK